MGIPIEKSFDLMSENSLTENELNQLMELFRRYYKETETLYLNIFDGMTEQLAELHEKYKLFVVSSKKTDVLKRNLKKLKVEHFFLEVIGSDKVENYKPSPDGILYILNKYNLHRNQTVYIGDAVFDIKMANNANIDSCAVTWGSHDVKELKRENPTFIITNVHQLDFEE
ncbi:HAD hydrolase, family IA, variant 1 [Staphylococcus warneri L37603]|jgi:phosphoglycolate phosphatase|nr:HAD hydrolase, family IA, variant 1 [Staphylococcus warneri L37603]